MHFHPGPPSANSLLAAWDFRLDTILVLGTATLLYVAGWWRLRRKGQPIATVWRLASYLGGILVLVLALMSALDTYQYYLFYMHMIQHLLLAMIAPPLLWLASPLPIGLWALQRDLRKSAALLLGGKSPVRKALTSVTPPFISWIVFMGVLWGWHDPNAYNAALRSNLIHDLEHVTFFGTAMLFWWHAINAAPRIHGPFPPLKRMLYVLLAFFLNLGPSIAITFAERVIYTHYLDVPRIAGISALQDQHIAGLIMWIPGGMMYGAAALLLIVRLLTPQNDRPTVRRPSPQQALSVR